MSKLLPIIIHPNPILRQKSAKIKKISHKIKRLALDMEKTMLEKDGIGLAAPQVGKNLRIIAINTKDGPLLMFNPKITRKSWLKEWGEEGCLSLPKIYGKVKRKRNVRAVYLDENGQKKKIKAEGLLARVIQHEIDHLNGVLFIDYMAKKDLPEGVKK